MTAFVQISDPKTNHTARVSEFGQLITAPIAYTTPTARTLAVVDEPVNFVEPEANHQVVITDIILSSDKNVGANGASVQVYFSDAVDSSNIVGGILDIEMLKNTSRDLIGLNFIVGEGLWVNAKTNDNNIQVTIGYYRVPIK